MNVLLMVFNKTDICIDWTLPMTITAWHGLTYSSYPLIKVTPSAIRKKWPHKRGGLSFLLLYNLGASEIWPD